MSDETPKPEKKTDWREGRHPLSVRVKHPDKVKFMEQLIAQQGNQQAALDHCITLAMGAPAGTGDEKQIAKLRAELDDVRSQNKKMQEVLNDVKQVNHIMQEENEKLKSTKWVFDDETMIGINKLTAKKQLSSMRETVAYAVKYTLKNDWL